MITSFILRKKGSADAHFSSWDLSDLNILNWLGIVPNEKKCEVGYIRILRIAGIPGLAFFITIFFDCLTKILKIINLQNNRSASDISLMYGFLGYIIAFMLYLFNHEPIYSFSNMGFFSCIIIIVNSFLNQYSIDANDSTYKQTTFRQRSL